MTDLDDRYEEVHERVVRDEGPVPVERYEREETVRDAGMVRHERVVEDEAAEQMAVTSKLISFVWLLTGMLEILLGLRFVLKLMAANPAAPFVDFIYTLSTPFLWPFFGITGTPAANDMVLEIPTAIAMVVYALLAWIIVRVIRLAMVPTESRSVSVSRRERY
ncbi:MAG: hypothetical protein RRC07_06080 [Anaerolineae bacterium]|nr:hypothetical protein [Anaerolineae bacterium]